MLTLPDRPHLDHLRQQAKDLHAQLRTDNPETTLAAAQTMLAGEYGFRDWPTLRTEVERRRANPTDASDAPAAAVSAAFGLGQPTGPLRAEQLGWAGQVWSLTTDRGRWRLTQLHDHIPTDNLETELSLVEAAVAAGVVAPEPVRGVDGQPLTMIEGRRWRAHRDDALGPAVSAPITADDAAGIGTTVAILHALRLPAPGPVHRWLTHGPGPQCWQESLERSRAADADWADLLEETLPALLDLSSIVDDRDPAEPAQLSHGSPGPTTVHRRSDGRLSLTSWDHACAIPPSWELGTVLHDWGIDLTGRVNRPAVAGIVTAYRAELSRRGVEGEPYLGLGMFSGKVTGWLNWTSSRINIALSGSREQKLHDHAAREVPLLLRQPIRRDTLEEILIAARAG